MSAALNRVRFERKLKLAAALRQQLENQQAWIKANGATLYGYRHKLGPKRGNRQYAHDCNLLQSLTQQLDQTGIH